MKKYIVAVAIVIAGLLAVGISTGYITTSPAPDVSEGNGD